MQERSVLLEVSGPLARITLNRGARLNAMDLAWIEDLNAAVDRLETMPELSVVVVSGAGRAFCAGLDLDMLEARRHAARLSTKARNVRFGSSSSSTPLRSPRSMAIAWVAACNSRSPATSACAAPTQRSACPRSTRGCSPGLAPFRLPHLVGKGAAARLILSGENVDADEALRIGLVDYVLPVEQFDSGLERILQRYLAAPRAAVVGSKRLMRHAFSGSHEEAYELSLPLLQACLDSADVAAAREAATPPNGGLKIQAPAIWRACPVQ